METKVYVGNLSSNTTEDALKAAFAAYDPIDATVMRDEETQRTRGFGFVTFHREEDAKRAIEDVNGQILDGRNVRVDFANKKPTGGTRRGSPR